MRCASCGAETSNVCRLCDECVATQAHAEAATQGLDPIERDPVRAARLAQRLSYVDRRAS